MIMDFKKIIIKGYRESETHSVDEKDKSSIRADYFVRMAKIATELDFTLEDFFDECKTVLNEYTLNLMAVWLERLDVLDKIIEETEKAIKSGQTHGTIIDDSNGNVKFDSTGSYSLTDLLERAKNKKISLDELDGYKKSAFWVDENGEKAEKDHPSNIAINNPVLEKLKNDLEKAEWWLKNSETDKTYNQTTEKVINTPTLSTNEIQEKPKADEKNYRYEVAKIAEIYDFCIDKDDRVFSSVEVSPTDFLNAVSSANFKSIYNENGTIKVKLRYVIAKMQEIIGREWYLEAAKSMVNIKHFKNGFFDLEYRWKKKADKI